MEKYTKPFVKKIKVKFKESTAKQACCGGVNSRKMPDFKFTTK